MTTGGHTIISAGTKLTLTFQQLIISDVGAAWRYVSQQKRSLQHVHDSVVTSAGAVLACVTGAKADPRVQHVLEEAPSRDLRVIVTDLTGLPPELEGITWCYGWSGPAVDALRAAEALVAET